MKRMKMEFVALTAVLMVSVVSQTVRAAEGDRPGRGSTALGPNEWAGTLPEGYLQGQALGTSGAKIMYGLPYGFETRALATWTNTVDTKNEYGATLTAKYKIPMPIDLGTFGAAFNVDLGTSGAGSTTSKGVTTANISSNTMVFKLPIGGRWKVEGLGAGLASIGPRFSRNTGKGESTTGVDLGACQFVTSWFAPCMSMNYLKTPAADAASTTAAYDLTGYLIFAPLANTRLGITAFNRTGSAKTKTGQTSAATTSGATKFGITNVTFTYGFQL